MEQDRNYRVVECCPDCENEILMHLGIENLGYKAYCLVCGNTLTKRYLKLVPNIGRLK